MGWKSSVFCLNLLFCSYESKTSAGLYERLMSKYEADPDDPMAKFSKSGKAREVKDMQGIKDRVKSSLRREEEDSQHPTRKRYLPVSRAEVTLRSQGKSLKGYERILSSESERLSRSKVRVVGIFILLITLV